jgi:hypothetical protein
MPYAPKCEQQKEEREKQIQRKKAGKETERKWKNGKMKNECYL